MHDFFRHNCILYLISRKVVEPFVYHTLPKSAWSKGKVRKNKRKMFCQNNLKSSLKSTLLKEKGPKDKNHVYFSNFVTFSAKIYAETLNTQRKKLKIWILLVFLGKFSFLQVYIHDPLHVCIMYLLNRKVVFGKRSHPKRNFFSSKIEFSFLFGNFGALLANF